MSIAWKHTPFYYTILYFAFDKQALNRIMLNQFAPYLHESSVDKWLLLNWECILASWVWAGEASRTENLFFVEIDFQISHFRSKSPNLSEIEDVCACFCNTNWLWILSLTHGLSISFVFFDIGNENIPEEFPPSHSLPHLMAVILIIKLLQFASL